MAEPHLLSPELEQAGRRRRRRATARCRVAPTRARAALDRRRVRGGDQQQPRLSGSASSRCRKLSSIRPDSGSARGNPKPPASSAADAPRGSSSRASGLPRDSATIRSRTRSSSRPGITDPSTLARRHRAVPRGPAPAAPPVSPRLPRGEDEDDGLGLQAARDERERLRRNPSSHCASSIRHTTGRSWAASDRRLSTASRRGTGPAAPRAEAERHAERVALRDGKLLAVRAAARTADAGSRTRAPSPTRRRRRGPPCTPTPLGRVLQQRRLADPGSPRRPAPRYARRAGPPATVSVPHSLRRSCNTVEHRLALSFLVAPRAGACVGIGPQRTNRTLAQ